ncbi:hypothetical protein [Rhodococcus sp. CH91]|uniref:hypothetical protein n=1 Tax=Rhodococcus sp. CH91 TaxID=2910256 RepID=UPI001F4A101F|nr:hypothetical protein [Rhodococcus sp. CH91]
MNGPRRSEDVGFLLDVLDLRPGMSVLVIDRGTVSGAVTGQVGPRGRVCVASDPARAHEQFGRHGPFDRICAVRVPDLLADPAPVAALAPLLAEAGQLWVLAEAGPADGTGTVSMTVSTLLAQAGYAIVDILERGSLVAVWAAGSRVTHGAASLR